MSGSQLDRVRRYSEELLKYQRRRFSGSDDLWLANRAAEMIVDTMMRCGAWLLPEGSADIGGIAVLCGRAFRDDRDAEWLTWAMLNPDLSLADLKTIEEVR